MFCEYCGSKLTGQETECPRCRRRTGFAVQTEILRNGRGVPVGAYKEEDILARLSPPASDGPAAGREQPEEATVQPKPVKDHDPELEEMRSSYSRLSKDYDQTRRQLELSERQNEKLRKRSMVSGIALLILSIVLIVAAVILILQAVLPGDGDKKKTEAAAVVTETPTPEPTVTEEPTPEPTVTEEPTPTPVITETPTPAADRTEDKEAEEASKEDDEPEVSARPSKKPTSGANLDESVVMVESSGETEETATPTPKSAQSSGTKAAGIKTGADGNRSVRVPAAAGTEENGD